MKYFTFLFLFMTGMTFTCLPVSYAEQSQPLTLESISYVGGPDEQESIVFKFNGSITAPNVFRLNGGKPRLVIDFPQATYKGGKAIPVDNRKFAYGIRVGTHTAPVMKTRAVIDLLSEYEVKYEKIPSVNNTVLTLVLSPISLEKIEDTDIPQISLKQVTGLGRTKPPENIPPVPAEKDPPVGSVAITDSSDRESQLLEISFDNSSNKGEMVIFRLNDFYPPTVSAIEEETPRVLCDFMDMQLGSDVKQVILAKGKYVERIRTAQHQNPDKIRVVLDLSPDRDYDLQQVFFKNDNIFVLIVNELPVKEVSDKQPL